MGGLNGRVRKLEDRLGGEPDDLPLAERLAAAIEAARERQRLGLPRPEPPEGDDFLSQRLRRGWERAEWLRRQFTGST
jgi:hypothetical protein